MNLYHLKAFFTLGNIKSFTKTADHLCVTQSAVSHSIKNLETSIDMQLIERRGKQVFLTGAGKRLYQSCKRVFYEIEKAEQDINQFREKAFYNIRVGSTVEFGTTILINHIRRFLNENRDIHLDFVFSPFLRDPLMQDKVDLIIDCENHLDHNLEKIPLFREQFIAIASPAFMEEKKINKLDDLERVNILSYDKDMDWWYNFIAAIPQEKQDCFKNVVQINHVRGLINAAIAGLGIAFVPKYTVINELKEGVLLDPFPQIKPLADDFNIFIKKEKLEFDKNRILIDYLTQLKPSEFGVD